MSNYDQFMRHWKNHRKDRYFQQCSGYFGRTPAEKSNDEITELEKSSFTKLLEELKQQLFPIYIVANGGYWTTCDEKNLFGIRIDSYEQLKQFGIEYVY